MFTNLHVRDVAPPPRGVTLIQCCEIRPLLKVAVSILARDQIHAGNHIAQSNETHLVILVRIFC